MSYLELQFLHCVAEAGYPRSTIFGIKLLLWRSVFALLWVIERPNKEYNGVLQFLTVSRLIDCDPTVIAEVDGELHATLMYLSILLGRGSGEVKVALRDYEAKCMSTATDFLAGYTVTCCLVFP